VVPFAFSDATCAAQGEPGSAKQERDSAPWLLSDRQHRVFRLCWGTRLRLSTFVLHVRLIHGRRRCMPQRAWTTPVRSRGTLRTVCTVWLIMFCANGSFLPWMLL
jgi:hypothetical protein